MRGIASPLTIYNSCQKLTRNAAGCYRCGDVVESKTVHDFRSCRCGAIFVDGGLEYVRYGGDLRMMEPMHEYDGVRVSW